MYPASVTRDERARVWQQNHFFASTTTTTKSETQTWPSIRRASVYASNQVHCSCGGVRAVIDETFVSARAGCDLFSGEALEFPSNEVIL